MPLRVGSARCGWLPVGGRAADNSTNGGNAVDLARGVWREELHDRCVVSAGDQGPLANNEGPTRNAR
jgi:hypothetical protein